MNYSVDFKKQYLTLPQLAALYDYANWLEDNVGREWDMWQWKSQARRPGSGLLQISAAGVLFYLEEDAVAFKLKFSA